MSIQRNTVQRQIVLNALQKLNNHPTIEEIYTVIHGNHPSISKTTVYRNLRQLADAGTIRRISLPDGLERYDASAWQHYHFRCKKCGCIIDVNIDYLAGIDETVQSKYNIQIDEHHVVFSGICNECKSKKHSIGLPEPKPKIKSERKKK